MGKLYAWRAAHDQCANTGADLTSPEQQVNALILCNMVDLNNYYSLIFCTWLINSFIVQ